jgi:hypothetical protein
MALLLGRRFQTEEERTGPTDTCDLSRYLGKRAEPFTVQVKAVVQHGQTMSDSGPFPNQDGSRLQSSSGWLSQRASLRPVPAPALEQAASGRFEAADCIFLQPIPECLDQQVAVNPARSIRFEQVAPGLVQLFRAEGPEIFDFRREALDVR